MYSVGEQVKFEIKNGLKRDNNRCLSKRMNLLFLVLQVTLLSKRTFKLYASRLLFGSLNLWFKVVVIVHICYACSVPILEPYHHLGVYVNPSQTNATKMQKSPAHHQLFIAWHTIKFQNYKNNLVKAERFIVPENLECAQVVWSLTLFSTWAEADQGGGSWANKTSLARSQGLNHAPWKLFLHI